MTLLYLDIDKARLPANSLPWITQCCKLWRWPLEAVRYDRTKRGWHKLAASSVSWANWKGRVSEGDADDLDNFRAILMAVGDSGLRVGAVKENEL